MLCFGKSDKTRSIHKKNKLNFSIDDKDGLVVKNLDNLSLNYLNLDFGDDTLF